jgi:hypothetical protein
MGLLPEVISNNEDADFQDGPSGTKLDIDQMHFVEIGEIHPETYILVRGTALSPIISRCSRGFVALFPVRTSCAL